ncbi:MAG TPA: glucose 1-dehydrogenase [Methylophilaceae bacterium]|jgi:3-oxoacyl-[acyl-carrier protein] reductase
MSQKLAGKVAVVTGASKGIGASTAKHLAAEGAAVVVNYAKSQTAAESVVAEIVRAGGKAIAVKADVSNQEDIVRLFTATKNAFGAIDVLVNNAGIYQPAPLAEITADNFHQQIDLNVLGLLLTTQEAVKHFNAAGGSIINISSVVSSLGIPDLSVYSSTKGAVDSITRSLAKELAARKIRVNSINPGMVETEGLHETGFIQNSAHMASITPLGRIGQPEDISPAVVFFASQDSAWITGETLFITGGLR